jgi:hypothetical protein
MRAIFMPDENAGRWLGWPSGPNGEVLANARGGARDAALRRGRDDHPCREECDVAAGQRRRHGASPRSTLPVAGPVANNSGRSSGNTPRRAIQRDEVTHY